MKTFLDEERQTPEGRKEFVPPMIQTHSANVSAQKKIVAEIRAMKLRCVQSAGYWKRLRQ
ncbi:hypothetical protein [Denitratimonas sp. CY0512]|uniref:hypothetical protein n=1 Tax=Denitratimonas sp. CY0512 TaxID=3131940 RepID=UPI0030B1FEBE